jgi:anti-anti-sigma factor
METEKLKIKKRTVSARPDISWIEISGSLNSLEVRSLEDLIIPLIEARQNIILDAGGLEYANSTGILAIMRYHIKSQRQGSKIILVRPRNQTVYDALIVCGAFNLLAVAEDVHSAVKLIG